WNRAGANSTCRSVPRLERSEQPTSSHSRRRFWPKPAPGSAGSGRQQFSPAMNTQPKNRCPSLGPLVRYLN
ncbi:hypothetical protein RB213_001501, partial [Colletotrichum asianum]